MDAQKRSRIGPNTAGSRLARLDGRTRIAQFANAVNAELLAACGGNSATIGHRLLIGSATVKAVRLQLLSKRLLDEEFPPEEVERRFKWHSNSLREDLRALGLLNRPGATRVPSLSEYVEERAA